MDDSFERDMKEVPYNEQLHSSNSGVGFAIPIDIVKKRLLLHANDFLVYCWVKLLNDLQIVSSVTLLNPFMIPPPPEHMVT